MKTIEELSKLTDEELFEEIRDAVNYSRNHGPVSSTRKDFRERCRLIGLAMHRRGWKRRDYGLPLEDDIAVKQPGRGR